MSEKYFIYTSGVLIFLTVFLFCGIALFMRYRYLKKLVGINTLKRQQKINGTTFYASAVLEIAVTELFLRFFSKEARQSLALLCGGRLEKSSAYFSATNPALSLLLAAHGDNLENLYVKLLGKKTLQKKKPFFLLFLVLISHIQFDETTFCSLQKKIKVGILPKKLRPYAAYIAAVRYLNEADMLSASQKASEALEGFKKHNFTFEEAQTYLLLAEIYRISCVNDIAQTMIESAKKIFNLSLLPIAEARAEALLGRLMLFENRYEEAEDKLDSALSMADNMLKADIQNQQVLLKIAQKKEDEAFTLAKTALKENRRCGNRRGEAFSSQLLSHILATKNEYKKAATESQKAANLYLKQENISAYAECLYLKASVLCRMQNYVAAEKLLRHILELKKQYSLNFHIANVYSLLGLIYLWRNDLSRAKTLLQQSLYLEQRNERCPGLAADYANLALIEMRSGNVDTANEQLKIALDYATKTENEDLIALINTKISPT